MREVYITDVTCVHGVCVCMYLRILGCDAVFKLKSTDHRLGSFNTTLDLEMTWLTSVTWYNDLSINHSYLYRYIGISVGIYTRYIHIQHLDDANIHT